MCNCIICVCFVVDHCSEKVEHAVWWNSAGPWITRHEQARSQDRFLGGAGPPQSGTFGPKKWTFEPHPPPPQPSYKNPFLTHFVT